MQIRLANIEELDLIKEIYNSAKSFMDSSGNSGQWVNNYPQKELLQEDIKNKSLFVCIDNNKIVAVFSFFVGIEPTYNTIYDGQWLNDAPYGVIHRIAVAEHQKGYASKCIQWCLNKCPNIKIDTHKNNIPMQKTILKNEFVYCGIIKKPDSTERLAYQSIPKSNL